MNVSSHECTFLLDLMALLLIGLSVKPFNVLDGMLPFSQKLGSESKKKISRKFKLSKVPFDFPTKKKVSKKVNKSLLPRHSAVTLSIVELWTDFFQ